MADPIVTPKELLSKPAIRGKSRPVRQGVPSPWR
jgi:hypothetical protein